MWFESNHKLFWFESKKEWNEPKVVKWKSLSLVTWIKFGCMIRFKQCMIRMTLSFKDIWMTLIRITNPVIRVMKHYDRNHKLLWSDKTDKGKFFTSNQVHNLNHNMFDSNLDFKKYLFKTSNLRVKQHSIF